MENPPTQSNDISVDSLEAELKKKSSLVDTISDDNVETVLVPFYEQDVLIKVPKEIRKKKNKPGEKPNKCNNNVSSYLVNKNKEKRQTSSYLERFRSQFMSNPVEKKPADPEIRSLSPEVGDTDRADLSFGDDEASNPIEEFRNTEAYNEIYYENFLQQQMENDADNYSDDGICFNDDLGSKSPDDNLRSVSEVSERVSRRQRRRVTVEPVSNVKLGGLGPDMELIRPQILRARSLQRYSDRVRAANRMSIYKKTATEEKQNIKDITLLHLNKNQKLFESKSKEKNIPQNTTRQCVVEEKVSYLVNKSSEKTIKLMRNSCKSANPARTSGTKVDVGDRSKSKSAYKKSTLEKLKLEASGSAQYESVDQPKTHDSIEVNVKSNHRTRSIKTEIRPGNQVPPIQISFLVNMGQTCPPALRNLEEKHRQYQELVKQYMKDYQI